MPCIETTEQGLAQGVAVGVGVVAGLPADLMAQAVIVAVVEQQVVHACGDFSGNTFLRQGLSSNKANSRALVRCSTCRPAAAQMPGQLHDRGSRRQLSVPDQRVGDGEILSPKRSRRRRSLAGILGVCCW